MDLKDDCSTEFSFELLSLFSPHPKGSGAVTSKKEGAISGWETCDDLHEEELEFHCATNRPYVALQLMQMSLADSEETASDVLSRPNSVNCEIKRRNKALSSLNVTIRRSKSSRCFQSGISSSVVRRSSWGSGCHPGCDSRFPMLFQGIREIKYDFRPFRHHQQHVDAYRNSYTYALIRNFRELHSTGVLRNKFQATPRFNLFAGAESGKQKGEQAFVYGKSNQQRKKRGTNSLNESPVVYYTDKCQTGPVVNLGEFLSPGACFLPKSTMEINAQTLRPSQHRPFGKQDLQKKLEQTALKSTKPSSTPLFRLKRKCSSGPVGLVAVASGLRRGKANFSSARKVSPLSKVPVAIHRSSPSIRGRRDPVSGVDGVHRVLSIAVATHTVASPYHSNVSQSQEDLSINAEL